MKIFADSAVQLNDSQEPASTGNYRYSDESAKYAAGFPYLAKLNSAMLNGVLHRITSNIAKNQYINASAIKNFPLTYLSKYCSDADIADPDAKNTTNYVLNEQVNAFITAHAIPKKKETVKALLAGQQLDNTTYYDSSEASKARSVAYGIELTPYVALAYPFDLLPPTPQSLAIAAIPSRTMLFPPMGIIARGATAHVKLSIAVDAAFHIFEIRNSFNKNTNKKVQTYVQFSSPVTYHAKNIPANAVIKCLGTGTIILKGAVLYAFSGFDDIPTSNAPLHMQTTPKAKKQKKRKT